MQENKTIKQNKTKAEQMAKTRAFQLSIDIFVRMNLI